MMVEKLTLNGKTVAIIEGKEKFLPIRSLRWI